MLNVPVNNFSVMSGRSRASWVLPVFSGSKCVFAQGHNTAEVGIGSTTSRSGVRDSTTRPPRSPLLYIVVVNTNVHRAAIRVLDCRGVAQSNLDHINSSSNNAAHLYINNLQVAGPFFKYFKGKRDIMVVKPVSINYKWSGMVSVH